MPDRALADLEAMVGEKRRSVAGLTVEAGKVAEFARATGDDHPVFHDPVEGPRPAPLAFTRVSFFPRYRPPGVGEWYGFDLGFREEHVLHGEQTYEYDRPVVVGDTLSATTTLADVYQRERSEMPPMTFAVFRTEYTGDVDDPVLTSLTTRIEVPPGDRVSGNDGVADPEEKPSPDLSGPGGVAPERTRTFGPLARADFVRFAGASGDFNPVHFDEPYATAHGHPQVFGQGMLTAGYASVLLTDWVGPRRVEHFSTRFEAQVWPGDTVTVCGSEREAGSDDDRVEIDLWVVNGRGETVLTGSATARRPDR